ncbi:hypothetical protein A4A49_53783 [Nicotiana attenuata]|uniref:Uncharacterized protein n=1 Tax=Nicotiana attenuata TaxID=49451 RepID=A0A314KRZ9_NICAT|nr:hypothetical protein A4A49_53783 [Nicotiana attenuata]
MKGTGRGKSGRGRTRYSGGNIQGPSNSVAASQPRIHPIGITEASLETGQSCNPSQRPIQTGRIFGNPLQRPSGHYIVPEWDWQKIVLKHGEAMWLKGQLQELVTQQQSEEIEHPMTRDEILSSVLGERTCYVRGKGYGKMPPKKSHMQQANIEASVSSAMEVMRQEMQAAMDRKLQEEREQMAAELRRNMEDDLKKKIGRGA